MAFTAPFLRYFQKHQFLVVKKIELIFDALHFYIYKLEKSVPDF